MMKLFQGIVKYIKECPQDELVGFSLTQIIYDANIKMTTIDRMEKMKPATEDNL